jgi:predicted nucleic acid-binding protein
MRRSEIFVDTSFVVALLNTRDQSHHAAVAVENGSGTRLVLTRAICMEIGNALTGPLFRIRAADLLAGMEQDPRFMIIPWEERVYAEALSLFRNRPDKAWSLTDCMSFVVMRERGITEALTTDHHFRQAGFRPLLQPSPN